MNNLQTVFERVSAWNAARYEQEYSNTLAVSLLREEYTEWLHSVVAVDKLDALCDITYVALGIVWKANVHSSMFGVAFHNSLITVNMLVDSFELNPAYFIGSLIDALEYEADYPVTQSVANIIALSLAQALSMGLSEEQFTQALLVVCDSNDSKSVKKVASDIKANAGDKGLGFIPPEPRLLKILAEVKPF
jgi:hypothetical protein